MAKKDIEDEFEDDEEFEDESPSRKNRRKPGPKKGSKNRKKVVLKEETRQSICGVIFFVFAILIVLSIFKIGGIAGDFLMQVLGSFLGIGYYILPIVLGVVGVSFMRRGRPEVATLHAVVGSTLILSILGICDI